MAWALLGAPAGALSFTPLGFLAGGVDSGAAAISSDGTMVVGWSRAPGQGNDGVRWSVATGVPELLSHGTTAYAVSADGSVIAGGTGSTASAWIAPGYAGIGIGGAGEAYGVNGDGSVIVGRAGDAARWVGSTHTEIQLGAGPFSIAMAVSDDGAVIVGLGRLNGYPGYEAFRWTALTGAVGIGDLDPVGIEESRALGISGDGQTIVGSSGNKPFAWTAGTGMYTLSPYTAGSAYDASSDGNVIVGVRYVDAITERAVVWNTLAPGFVFDLNEVATGVLPEGWVLLDALGVSADGLSIVGRARDGSGHQQAYLLRLDSAPIPEPGTGALFAIGLLVLRLSRTRA